MVRSAPVLRCRTAARRTAVEATSEASPRPRRTASAAGDLRRCGEWNEASTLAVESLAEPEPPERDGAVNGWLLRRLAASASTPIGGRARLSCGRCH